MSVLRKIDAPCRPECGLHAQDCPTTQHTDNPCNCTGTPRQPTVAQAIIQATRAGAPMNTAARWAGVWPDTVSRWTRRGTEEIARMVTTGADEPKPTETLYVDLALELTYSNADAQMRMIADWESHFDRDWRSVQAFMARRWRSEWGDVPKRLELTGAGGGPVELSGVPVLSVEEAETMVAEIEMRARMAAAERGEVLEIGEAT